MIPYDALENNFRIDFLPESPLCSQSDPELFFVEDKHSTKQIAKAKGICHFCPEIKACRTYALKADERYGIWGGLTEEERRVIRSNDKEKVRAGHSRGLDAEVIAGQNGLALEYVQKLIEEISRVPRGWMLKVVVE